MASMTRELLKTESPRERQVRVLTRQVTELDLSDQDRAEVYVMIGELTRMDDEQFEQIHHDELAWAGRHGL